MASGEIRCWSEMEAWTSWTDRKPWEIASGELRWEGARRKRGHCGRMGNRGKYSFRSEREGSVDIFWTGRKPCEIAFKAWRELRWEERDGSVDIVDGQETVWEIASGELRWEGDGSLSWTGRKQWEIASRELCLGSAIKDAFRVACAVQETSPADNVSRSGRSILEMGCVLEHQIFRFATVTFA